MSRQLFTHPFRSVVHTTARRPQRKFFRPKLDSLEDRTVPAQLDLSGFASNLMPALAPSSPASIPPST